MVMTEIFEKLKSLQDILAEKYEIEGKIEEAPKRLGAQEELLARLKKEYIERNNIYEEIRTKVLKLKADLAEAEKSRESGEKGMDNITTHREYEALDKQITEATAREQEIRKDLQKEEKNLAELNENLKSDEAMITSQESDLSSSKDSLNKELEDYKTQLADLEKQESDITPGIDQEIVYKFQRIIQRNRQGIVAVQNGVCGGCHMILPAQFANEVREGEKILFCPYCSRILYYKEDSGNGDYFNVDDSESLADLAGELDDEDLLDDEESDDSSDADDSIEDEDNETVDEESDDDSEDMTDDEDD
jgi:predicted  nucleic acid-binding Zn-ribbon protein